MRTLYLLRHANAVSTDAIPDIERELDAIGINEAEEIGQQIKIAGIVPDVILTSTAARTSQTAQIIARQIGHIEGALRPESKLYNTQEEKYLEIIQQMDNKVQTLMIVGHNPTISNLAVTLCKDFTESLPTAALLAIDFDVDEWQYVNNHRGKRGLFIIPGQGRDGV